jgi:hypothetical protein
VGYDKLTATGRYRIANMVAPRNRRRTAPEHRQFLLTLRQRPRGELDPEKRFMQH